MKKSQLHAQVFIYIMAIIVVGLILLFGYKGIKSIVLKSCSVEEVDFNVGLERIITNNNRDGSSENVVMDAPCGYEELCFVSAEAICEQCIFSSQSKAKALIENSVTGNVLRNVFLIKGRNINSQIIYFPQLKTKTNSEVCIEDVNGKFRFFLEGIGRNVYVSQITP